MTEEINLQRIKELINSKSVLKGDEYKRFVNTQESVDFLMENCSSFFLFLDLSNMNYQYVSPSIYNVLGYNHKTFSEQKIEYIFSLFHPDTVQTQRAIYKEITNFFADKTIKDRMNFKFSFDLRLRHSNGLFVRFLQHNKILYSTKEGIPLLIFIQCQNVTNCFDEHKQTLIFTKNVKGIEKVVFKKEFFPYFENKILTLKETMVWRYISDGLSSKDIAKEMNISINTVLTHRKRVYKKIKMLNN
jgi:hypothetical protein